MAGMWIVGEDMPQEKNGVTLHPTEKDRHGLPIPNVHFDDHANDVAMRNHAYKQGRAVYEAVGAKQVFENAALSLDPQPGHLPAKRPRPEDGVCNKFGQTHDITNLFISDGSQFTTGAAENPTLTVVTLAIRQADYLADQMSKGEKSDARALGRPRALALTTATAGLGPGSLFGAHVSCKPLPC